jgi:hypothetical protein
MGEVRYLLASPNSASNSFTSTPPIPNPEEIKESADGRVIFEIRRWELHNKSLSLPKPMRVLMKEET